MSNRSPWTTDEEFQLDILAGKYTLDTIACKLGRSKSTIANKMRELGISNRAKGMTLPEVAQAYGCPIVRVRKMVYRGQVKATRPNKNCAWSIDPDHIGPKQLALLQAPLMTWKKGTATAPRQRIIRIKTIDSTRWTIPTHATKQPWGYSVTFSEKGAPYTGKVFWVGAGQMMSLQVHDQKDESVCCIQGRAQILIGRRKYEMEIGKGYHIIRGTRHRIMAIQNCVIVESSTPEIGKTYRLEDMYGRRNQNLG